MMDDKTIEALGIDLSNPAAASEAAAEAKRRDEEAAVLAYAQAWDKLVQRAAKGIIPRPLRHARMRRNIARRERAEALAAAESARLGTRRYPDTGVEYE